MSPVESRPTPGVQPSVMSPRSLGIDVLPQPDDNVCGPTCLHGIYKYFGHDVELSRVISEIQELPRGGTLAVQLGDHALRRGFDAVIYTNNLQTFDPTWFRPGVDLAEKLRLQRAAKQGEKLRFATDSYLSFLKHGGRILLESFTLDLLRSYIDRDVPLLAGLSATYLYDCPRELSDGQFDDVAGTPTGHFVVIQGYSEDKRRVLVADPLSDNPRSPEQYYSVGIERLLAAMHLGIVTYDANLLVIEPRRTPTLSDP